MKQRTRVIAVAAVVLLLGVVLGVQAATVDRGTVAETDRSAGEPQPGNTLVGVHSWNDNGRLVEVTPDGEVVYEWSVPNSRVFGIDPINETHALVAVAVKVPSEECPEEYADTDEYPDHCVQNRVVLLDRANDEVDWEYRWHDNFIHWHEVHDVEMTDDGEVAVIDMGKNRAFTIDPETDEITWEWDAVEHLGEGSEFREEYGGPEYGGPYDDWTHMNDIDQLENGNFQMSIRNFDAVIEVDPETDEIVDVVGRPGNHEVMDRQHNPQRLEEHGTMVVADSENDRIVEIDVETEEVVWTYTGPKDDPLQWPRDADRLPNGNTLITDSRNNRVVEVNPEGEVVWRFEDPDGEVIPLPYAADRLPAGEKADGPSGRQLGESVEEKPGLEGRLREVETMSRWVLPTWMHLPQLLMLLGIVLGSAWLLGEGALYGWRRYRGR